jgi:hypothetical protein
MRLSTLAIGIAWLCCLSGCRSSTPPRLYEGSHCTTVLPGATVTAPTLPGVKRFLLCSDQYLHSIWPQPAAAGDDGRYPWDGPPLRDDGTPLPIPDWSPSTNAPAAR